MTPCGILFSEKPQRGRFTDETRSSRDLFSSAASRVHRARHGMRFRGRARLGVGDAVLSQYRIL